MVDNNWGTPNALAIGYWLLTKGSPNDIDKDAGDTHQPMGSLPHDNNTASEGFDCTFWRVHTAEVCSCKNLGRISIDFDVHFFTVSIVFQPVLTQWACNLLIKESCISLLDSSEWIRRIRLDLDMLVFVLLVQ